MNTCRFNVFVSAIVVCCSLYRVQCAKWPRTHATRQLKQWCNVGQCNDAAQSRDVCYKFSRFVLAIPTYVVNGPVLSLNVAFHKDCDEKRIAEVRRASFVQKRGFEIWYVCRKWRGSAAAEGLQFRGCYSKAILTTESTRVLRWHHRSRDRELAK